MKPSGYGITVDGKAVGIWPMDLAAAQGAYERYRLKYPDKTVEALPLWTGEPIKFTSPLDRILAHAGTLRKLPDPPEPELA